MLPISHDEVVHGKGSLAGKMPGDTWQRLANVRALLAYMWAHPGKQLLFMGCELADDREWSEERGLDWYLLHDPARAGVQRLVRRPQRGYYRDTPALWAQDTDAGRLPLDRRRRRRQQHGGVRPDRPGRLDAGVRGELLRGRRTRTTGSACRRGGTWTEVLNTDADHYGGSGVGNMGDVHAEDVPWHGMPSSAALRVPPLGALWLRPA